MSCNGCRVLRKGCSESCILRPCLQWIQNPKAQGYATVFVAKFFGRAGLISFISSVPENQRPALFQSLLFEACGRTINPVNGAVGLLWSGNWHLCQMAVETVLRGGILSPVCQVSESDDAAQGGGDIYSQSRIFNSEKLHPSDLDLYLMPDSSRTKMLDGGELVRLRPGTPSMNSDGSDTTNCDRNCYAEEQIQQGGKRKEEPTALTLDGHVAGREPTVHRRVGHVAGREPLMVITFH